MKRFVKNNLLLKVYSDWALTYLVPSNITYLWNFGSLAFSILLIQILSGLFLSMHYIPNDFLSFYSIEQIMRDINYGWLIRYIHSNGASMFFSIVYLHIFRGLYYGSYTYPRQLVWVIGIIILLLMIITAFAGHVLPWGQMSYWAATVILNSVTAIPLIGDDLVIFFSGGFSVGQPTLNRFYTVHFLLPFLIFGLVLLHLVFLHENGSGNPLGIFLREDRIAFSPYFIIKDFLGFIIFCMLFSYLIFFDPNLLSHTDNYIIANPMVTPTHIVPEWYFLPFYAISRSIPNKLGGVIALFCSILIPLIFPFFVKNIIKSCSFRPIFKLIFFFFCIICIGLGWIGGQIVVYPFYQIGQILTFSYFGIFILYSILTNLENNYIKYDLKNF